LRLANLPEFAPLPAAVIARDKVRYVGEPLAVVVARAQALAEDALEGDRGRYRAAAAAAGSAMRRRAASSLLFEDERQQPAVRYSVIVGRRRGGLRHGRVHPPRELSLSTA
jgi:carbon-monoxide dehydrogenase large subunit